MTPIMAFARAQLTSINKLLIISTEKDGNNITNEMTAGNIGE